MHFCQISSPSHIASPLRTNSNPTDRRNSQPKPERRVPSTSTKDPFADSRSKAPCNLQKQTTEQLKTAYRVSSQIAKEQRRPHFENTTVGRGDYVRASADCQPPESSFSLNAKFHSGQVEFIPPDAPSPKSARRCRHSDAIRLSRLSGKSAATSTIDVRYQRTSSFGALKCSQIRCPDS